MPPDVEENAVVEQAEPQPAVCGESMELEGRTYRCQLPPNHARRKHRDGTTEWAVADRAQRAAGEAAAKAQLLLGQLQGMTNVNQRTLLLRRGEAAGWFRFDAMSGSAARMSFQVTLPDGRRRVLRAEEVLPWLLGVADAAGEPEVVAYRPGLVGDVGID